MEKPVKSFKLLKQYGEKEKTCSFPLFLFLCPFLFPASVAPPYVKDPPSALPPVSFFPFCPSVPFLCVLSLSPPLPSPCTLWYADMQEFGPQNDRPNLSVLAPVTKDGRPASVCVPVIGACLSYSPCDWSYHVCPQPLCFFGKVWISVFWLCKTQFSSVIMWLLSDYNPPSVFSSAQFWVYRCMWYCMLLCLCRLLCVNEGCVTWSITPPNLSINEKTHYSTRWRQWLKIWLQPKKLKILVFCRLPDSSFYGLVNKMS